MLGQAGPALHRPRMEQHQCRMGRHSRLLKRRCAVHVRARLYSQPAQQAIKHAQQEACRQGSMFLAPPHLLQGLLDTPDCTAYQLLTAAGLTPAAAEAALVDPQMLPASGKIMSAGELHWAPDARKALQIAADWAEARGQATAGTPHLLLGLCECGNTAIKDVLGKAGIKQSDIRDKAEAAAWTCQEAAAPNQQPPPADAQAQALVQQYKQWVETQGDAAPPPPGSSWQTTTRQQPPARTAADDDIYE